MLEENQELIPRYPREPFDEGDADAVDRSVGPRIYMPIE
jgi:hypothetical protein